MREIKFRVWDKKTKRMIDLGGLPQIEDSQCKYWDDFEIMQHTGLKDKKGKELYEGDIVNVEYADGDTIICPVEIPAIYWQEPIRTWKFEIIGNIYENKELLSIN